MKHERRTSSSRCLVLGLAAGLLWAALPTQATPNRIVLPDGKVIHETEQAVRGERVLPVASSYQLHRWEEELPNGELRSFYAYSRTTKDGGPEIVGRVRETTHKIRLRDFQFDPLLEAPPSFPTWFKQGPPIRLHLVQLEATPLPEMRQAIEAAGATILRFLPDHTFLVRADPPTLAGVRALSFVRAAVPYHPLLRVESVLRDALEGRGDPLAAQRYSLMVGERGPASQQKLVATIRSLGGTVELVEPGGWRVEATLTHEQLEAVVADDEVQFVDRWGGPGETDMNVVRQVGGADYVESVAGYTGQGVRGEIFDTELRTTHQEWNHTPIIHSASTSCSSLHGTSCYSNNFAQGVDPDSRGVIPDGQGIFYCYAESTQFGGSKSRYDVNAELIDPAGPYRAVFQTSSVGSTRTFFYTTISAEVDDYLFQHQLLSTQSQSNAGNQDSRPQAWAKNIVSVGGIRHLNTATRCDDRHGNSGSTGPAEDGRIKPDLSYFYDSIRSASGSSNASYTSFGGTSSATPQTSGHFGILFQMWHDGVWAGHGGGVDVFDSRPKMATAKALMINSAYRYDWPNPGGCSYGDANRFRQGWGTANLERLYNRAPVTDVVDETDVIAPLETKTYTATVQPGETELSVTLVYVDPAGTVGAQVNRINDLSLRVTSPSSTVYWGNNGLTAGNYSTSGGSSNTIDTVENVFVQNPEAGSWTIEVIGDEIVEDAHVETETIDADFALVVSGGLLGPQCTTNEDCDDGVFCNGAETCVAGVCQPGVDPCPGQSCNEAGQFCESSGAQLEAACLSVNAAGTTVNLVNTYVSPVVVTTVQYQNSATSIVTRISNVTATSFEVRLQSTKVSDLGSENVCYLVVEEGTWTIDGVAVEAQKYLSTVTDEDGSWVGEAQSYNQSFIEPVVLGQVMSENDPNWSVFWNQGATRTAPPSATALVTGKTVCEDTNVVRADETVGFVVFEAGHGTIGGVEFEALVGADTVQGVDDAPPYVYTFFTQFATAPTVALATMAAVDGVNGGWAQIHGSTIATATTLNLSIDEDVIGDPERSHTTEQVAYLAFAGPVVFP